MKKLIATLAALFIVATVAEAQMLVGKGTSYASLPTCTSSLEDRVTIVDDADYADAVGNGGGSYNLHLRCASSAWSLVNSGQSVPSVANVTVADDAGGTKPAGAIPVTADIATCTCNDATGCAMTVAEPTVASGRGRYLTVLSVGTGNCEIADSSGVIELGATLVLEPTSTAFFAYSGTSWYRLGSTDNVP